MDVRGLVLVVGVLGASAAALTSACATPDPGEITYSERHGGTGDPGTSSGNPSSTGGPGTDGGGSSGTPGDGGGEGGTVMNAFTGAPAYNAAGTANGTAANPAHGGTGAPPSQDCLSCHGPGGAANAKWGFAGQIVNAAGGTAGLAKAEIRVVDGTGKEIDKVYSEGTGYFWSSAAAPPAGSMVGARVGTKIMPMAGKLAAGDGNCGKAGACHGGTQGKVYLVP